MARNKKQNNNQQVVSKEPSLVSKEELTEIANNNIDNSDEEVNVVEPVFSNTPSKEPLFQEAEIIHLDEDKLIEEQKEFEANKSGKIVRENLNVDKEITKLDPDLQLALNGVIDFVTTMNKFNNNISLLSTMSMIQKIGPELYTKLYRNVMSIINHRDEEQFNNAFKLLLKIFNDNRNGVLSYLSLCRYNDMLLPNIVVNYGKVMLLLTTLCNAKTARNEIKNLDMEYLLKGFTDKVKTRLLKLVH